MAKALHAWLAGCSARFLDHKLSTFSLCYLTGLHHAAPEHGTGADRTLRDYWEAVFTYFEEVLVSCKSYSQDQRHTIQKLSD